MHHLNLMHHSIFRKRQASRKTFVKWICYTIQSIRYVDDIFQSYGKSFIEMSKNQALITFCNDNYFKLDRGAQRIFTRHQESFI
ncbi:hypothetical protein TO64_20370 [Citrobacter freundii]|nr:hypothetical protein TO64_20370 [Citrobacter freundii]PCQ41806.1 hypothetical protein CQA28_15825 [Citrobacter freundii]PMC99920.1 hypothetical protein CJ200_20695 [Citrobacter freundii]